MHMLALDLTLYLFLPELLQQAPALRLALALGLQIVMVQKREGLVSPALGAQREQLPQRHASLPLTPLAASSLAPERACGFFPCLSAAAGTSSPRAAPRAPARPPGHARTHECRQRRGRGLGQVPEQSRSGKSKGRRRRLVL